MPLHIADEEEDLFPAFARHCAGEAEFEGIRTQLCKEHAPDDPLTRILEADLQILAAGGTLKDHAGFAAMACSFAEMQERHLNWENNTVLPLAEKCLDAEELREIGRSMVARRGMEYPAIVFSTASPKSIQRLKRCRRKRSIACSPLLAT